MELTKNTNKQSDNTDSKEGKEHMRQEKEEPDVEKMDEDSTGKPHEKIWEKINVSTQMAWRNNAKKKSVMQEMDFIKRLISFHGRKYSQRYKFKVMVEASATSTKVQLTKCFQAIFKIWN